MSHKTTKRRNGNGTSCQGDCSAVIRISADLSGMIDKTAEHTRQTVSDIFHAVRIGIIRGRNVRRVRIPEAMKSNLTVTKTVKNCCLCKIGVDEFRKHLYWRCLEELRKPNTANVPVFNEVPGVDYIIDEEAV